MSRPIALRACGLLGPTVPYPGPMHECRALSLGTRLHPNSGSRPPPGPNPTFFSVGPYELEVALELLVADRRGRPGFSPVLTGLPIQVAPRPVLSEKHCVEDKNGHPGERSRPPRPGGTFTGGLHHGTPETACRRAPAEEEDDTRQRDIRLLV